MKNKNTCRLGLEPLRSSKPDSTVVEFSHSCWYHFHVVHIAVMCKTYLYQKWNMDFFVLFNQQTQSFFLPIPCFVFSFYVLSHMHLQTRCASSNDFSVLMVLIQGLFWFIRIDFFFTLFTKSVGFVSFFLPFSTHTYTPFSNTIMNKMQWLKSKNLYNVTTDWLKLVKKMRMKWKKNELCGYLQWRRHGRSGNWVRKIPANHNTGNIEGNSVFRAIVVASW